MASDNRFDPAVCVGTSDKTIYWPRDSVLDRKACNVKPFVSVAIPLLAFLRTWVIHGGFYLSGYLKTIYQFVT